MLKHKSHREKLRTDSLMNIKLKSTIHYGWLWDSCLRIGVHIFNASVSRDTTVKNTTRTLLWWILRLFTLGIMLVQALLPIEITLLFPSVCRVSMFLVMISVMYILTDRVNYTKGIAVKSTATGSAIKRCILKALPRRQWLCRITMTSHERHDVPNHRPLECNSFAYLGRKRPPCGKWYDYLVMFM